MGNSYQQWEEETQKKLAAGLASVERGDVLSSEVVIERLKGKLQKARETQE